MKVSVYMGNLTKNLFWDKPNCNLCLSFFSPRKKAMQRLPKKPTIMNNGLFSGMETFENVWNSKFKSAGGHDRISNKGT